MERQHYTVSAGELSQHLKRVGVPKRAIVHYWYEVDTTQSSKPEETKNPQLNKLLSGFASFGGLTADDAAEMKKHSDDFKQEFEI